MRQIEKAFITFRSHLAETDGKFLDKLSDEEQQKRLIQDVKDSIKAKTKTDSLIGELKVIFDVIDEKTKLKMEASSAPKVE